MKNTLLKDMIDVAKNLEERLPKTGEGGVMILATDNDKTVIATVASPHEMKRMLRNLLANEMMQALMRVIISEDESKQGN